MALRLRKDVQKSSYYVWFLGAEEARGLRGPRVINPVLPYLIDRSKEQEPLKVTLQISHKGIKILQGSAKHFIPHSAITSSVQTDDIVACVLLLYNPATKCPLHVHAYRCDSDSTAEALHQQLQILINRPENKKRFEELEARLGITHSTSQNGMNSTSEQKQFGKRAETSPKRFESSLGSDTGNSTRESDCSDELSPISASPSIVKPKGDLFDSLAAELRAKLNGNGPPLLLPPRDYDTVHRSKGNLAAIELRRCRNSVIVGGPNTKKGSPTTPLAIQHFTSRGSSGIGSDLAPSPDRQDIHSSSEDENWSNEMDNSVIALKPSQISLNLKQQLPKKHPTGEDSYLRDLPANPLKSLTRDKEKPPIKLSQSSPSSSWSKEDEIRPIIMRPSDYDAKFKRVLQDRHKDNDPIFINQIQSDERQYPLPLKLNIPNKGKYNDVEKKSNKKIVLEPKKNSKISQTDMDSDPECGPTYRNENLTDKQKFQEYSSNRDRSMTDHQKFGRQRYDPNGMPFDSIQNEHQTVLPAYNHLPDRDRHCSVDRNKDLIAPDYFSHSNERNPYKEPESMSYIESIEKMMKSPVMRYKSFDDHGSETGGTSPHKQRDMIPRMVVRRTTSKTEKMSPEEYEAKDFSYSLSSRNYPDRSNSAKDRFLDAKEKFHAMERSRYSPLERDSSPQMYPRRRSSIEQQREVDVRYEDWTDEEPVSSSRMVRDQRISQDFQRDYQDTTDARGREDMPREIRDPRDLRDQREYRNLKDPRDLLRKECNEIRDPRGMLRDHREIRDIRDKIRDHQASREHRKIESKRSDANAYPHISNARSLSNLTKGHRHSYAEPALMSRAGGRVGLAAVNPF